MRDIATCVIIDGHALIQSLGRLHDCKTFGEYANVFANVVFNNFSNETTRVDVVFDRYLGKKSIKASTRSSGQENDDLYVRLSIVPMSHCHKCGTSLWR